MTTGHVKSTIESVEDSYAPDDDIPLTGFAALMSTYLLSLGTAGLILRGRGVRLPKQVSPADLALGAVAAHKISRTITKDSVTSPLRAPFTKFQGPAGHAELKEEVVGTGLRKAIGELVTCPFCFAQWVSTSLAIGFLVAPRQTRFVASIFAMKSGSDFLQFAYAAAERKAEG